jgi:hypothetical protein
MLPNLRGVITTGDGAEVIFELAGRTVWLTATVLARDLPVRDRSAPVASTRRHRSRTPVSLVGLSWAMKSGSAAGCSTDSCAAERSAPCGTFATVLGKPLAVLPHDQTGSPHGL